MLSSAVIAMRIYGYLEDLKCSLLMEPIVKKIPPRMREKWAMQIMKMRPQRATLEDFAKLVRQKSEKLQDGDLDGCL